MAGSLEITYADLRREIGRFLGWGRDPSTWSSARCSDGSDILKSGLRKFYAPAPLPGEKYSHEWSFLKPTTTMTLTIDDYQYDLPTDFSMFDGPLSYPPGDNTSYPPIEITSESRILQMLQRSDASGRPCYAAIRPKSVDTTLGTRWEILFDKPPDAAYVLHYRYKINPLAIDGSTSLPLGGQPHSETVREAVLSAAEEMFMPTSNAHQMKFIELLRGSVSHDRMASCPDTLGYNVDEEPAPYDPYWDKHRWNTTLVTYTPS